MQFLVSKLMISIVWSNFEIGDLDFWRGEAYSKFFDFLDKKGGFYYERWGDAPVHSIGAALLAPKDKLHFFNDIGYRHEPFEHCPMSDAHKRGKCWCTGEDNFGKFHRTSPYAEAYAPPQTTTGIHACPSMTRCSDRISLRTFQDV